MIVKRGDIFYADLSPVVGSEQGGLRPVLIVQNDVGNRYSPTVIAAAITSKTGKAKLPTHIDVSGEGDEAPGLARDSVILLEQVRTIDKRRLRERIGHLDLYTMQKVNSAISVSLGLMDEPSSYGIGNDAPAYYERTHLHSAIASVDTAPSQGTPPPSVAPLSTAAPQGMQSAPQGIQSAPQGIQSAPFSAAAQGHSAPASASASNLNTATVSIGSDAVKMLQDTSDAVFCSANTLSDTETNANVISAPHAVFEMVASTAAETTVNTLPLHPFSSNNGNSVVD